MQTTILALLCLLLAGTSCSNRVEETSTTLPFRRASEPFPQFEFEQTFDNDTFIFDIPQKNTPPFNWDKKFSFKPLVDKAKKFVKNNIGQKARYWEVDGFQIHDAGHLLNSHYYSVSFFTMPESGVLQGLCLPFIVYLDSSGEIHARKVATKKVPSKN